MAIQTIFEVFENQTIRYTPSFEVQRMNVFMLDQILNLNSETRLTEFMNSNFTKRQQQFRFLKGKWQPYTTRNFEYQQAANVLVLKDNSVKLQPLLLADKNQLGFQVDQTNSSITMTYKAGKFKNDAVSFLRQVPIRINFDNMDAHE